MAKKKEAAGKNRRILRAGPLTKLLLLVLLLGIGWQLYRLQSQVEAAQVDGATDLQVFWKVKWPQIMPTTLYILVITTINSFQCFALIQLLTSGGPEHATDTVMYYIYYSAFTLYKYGYANAMGVVLAIFIGLLSALQFKLAKEK